MDLIVVPNAPQITGPTKAGGCMLPAHGGLFWVFGPQMPSDRYKLLLAAYGFGLTVLNSRTNGYRDIEVGEEKSNQIYKFNLQQYQLARKNAAP